MTRRSIFVPPQPRRSRSASRCPPRKQSRRRREPANTSWADLRAPTSKNEAVPLTPAHAAMAWPLSVILRRVPMTALVIGTLSPDFEYLLRLAPRGEFGHSIAGVVFFCVPVSLTVWALFEKYARAALARMLPSTIGEALAGAGYQRSGSREAEFALAAVGTVVGALSHLAWDSFTHASGWAVLRIQALAEPIHVGSFPGLPVYKLLQHGSTVGGLLVVVLWVRKMLDGVTSAARRRRPYSIAPGLAERGRPDDRFRRWGHPERRASAGTGSVSDPRLRRRRQHGWAPARHHCRRHLQFHSRRRQPNKALNLTKAAVLRSRVI